jgi:acetyl-CoA carboxylase biotin carboxyl carrier protein
MAQSAEKQRGGKRSSPSVVTSVEENGRSAQPPSVSQQMIDLEFLRGLIDAVAQSGIDSIEINRAGVRIRIAKTPSSPIPVFPGFSQGMAPIAAPPVVPVNAAAVAAPVAPAEAAPARIPAKPELIDVTSPMVGTFYRAPAPDAPPYVEVGSTVTKGQTLCILEAMKLMNELPCELDGIVGEILVEDADPVEYGQVLFRIQPTSK